MGREQIYAPTGVATAIAAKRPKRPDPNTAPPHTGENATSSRHTHTSLRQQRGEDELHQANQERGTADLPGSGKASPSHGHPADIIDRRSCKPQSQELKRVIISWAGGVRSVFDSGLLEAFNGCCWSMHLLDRASHVSNLRRPRKPLLWGRTCSPMGQRRICPPSLAPSVWTSLTEGGAWVPPRRPSSQSFKS